MCVPLDKTRSAVLASAEGGGTGGAITVTGAILNVNTPDRNVTRHRRGGGTGGDTLRAAMVSECSPLGLAYWHSCPDNLLGA